MLLQRLCWLNPVKCLEVKEIPHFSLPLYCLVSVLPFSLLKSNFDFICLTHSTDNGFLRCPWIQLQNCSCLMQELARPNGWLGLLPTWFTLWPLSNSRNSLSSASKFCLSLFSSFHLWTCLGLPCRFFLFLWPPEMLLVSRPWFWFKAGQEDLK